MVVVRGPRRSARFGAWHARGGSTAIWTLDDLSAKADDQDPSLAGIVQVNWDAYRVEKTRAARGCVNVRRGMADEKGHLHDLARNGFRS